MVFFLCYPKNKCPHTATKHKQMCWIPKEMWVTFIVNALFYRQNNWPKSLHFKVSEYVQFCYVHIFIFYFLWQTSHLFNPFWNNAKWRTGEKLCELCCFQGPVPVYFAAGGKFSVGDVNMLSVCTHVQTFFIRQEEVAQEPLDRCMRTV